VDFTSAAPAVIGNTVTSGAITSSHVYRITGMVAGSTYRIYTCGLGGSGDTQLSIYAAGGGGSLAYDDDFGPECSSFEASLDFTPASSGSYDMEVTNYFCQTSGNAGAVGVRLLSSGGGGDLLTIYAQAPFLLIVVRP